MGTPPAHGLEALTEPALGALRDRFRQGGFTPELLGRAESVAPGQLDVVSLPLVRWTLARRADRAGRLALLFAYGDRVPAPDVEGDLGASLAEALVSAGLLRREADGLCCPFRLVPLEDLWILGDEPSAGPDAVMGPGPTTLELLGQLPARCDGRVLDLGTGAGTFALAMARRGAEQVVATDLNPRAALFAAFNARLNGLALDVRVGDLEAPVRGERFRWIVSQPAYVFQAPEEPRVVFLHGGTRGDELAFRALGAVPALLEDGGTALVLFDTPAEPSPPLPAKVRAALGDASLALLLLVAPGPSAGAQAVAYAALAHPSLGPGYGRAVERNRTHLESLGQRESRHVLAWVRRAPGHAPFTVQLPVPGLQVRGPEALERLLSGIRAAVLPPEALGEVPLAPLPGLRLPGEVTLDGEVDALQAVPARGSLAAGCPLGPEDVSLLRALASAPDVGAALAALGEEDGGWLERIRELAGRGLLVDRRVAGPLPGAHGPR